MCEKYNPSKNCKKKTAEITKSSDRHERKQPPKVQTMELMPYINRNVTVL